jgi:hypothetical protein
MMEYFGPGGEIDQIYGFLSDNTINTLNLVAGAMQQMAQITSSMGGMAEYANFRKAEEEAAWKDWMKERQSGGSPPRIGFAEGGTLIANRPTTVTFGEKGPEAATFSPLGRVGMDEGKTFVSGDGGGQSGKMSIELLLSPDLEARIIDKSFGGMADVFVREGR